MFLTRATQKGQITIPVHIRQMANISPNDLVLVEYDKDGHIIIKKAPDFFDLYGSLTKYVRKKVNKSFKQMRKEFLKYMGTKRA